MRKYARTFLFTLSAAAAVPAMSPGARADIIQVPIGVTINAGTSPGPDDSINILGVEFYSNYSYAGAYYNYDDQWVGWNNTTVYTSGDSGALVSQTAVTEGTMIGPSTSLLDATDFEAERVEYTPCCGLYGNGYNYFYDYMVNPLGEDLLPALFDNGDYGWIDLTVFRSGPGDGWNITFNSYSYDDTGAAVLAGAAPTPEPSTFALTLGALALARLARRRRLTARRLPASMRCAAGLAFIVLAGASTSSAASILVADPSDVAIYSYTQSGVQSVYSFPTGYSIEGMAFNSSGTLYAAAQGSNAVYQYSSTGVQSTLATVSSPYYLAVDSAGNVYTGANRNTLDKITPGGTVTTVASALSIEALGADSSGDVFEWDSSGFIYEFSSSGAETTYAADAPSGGGYGMAINGAGDIFVGDYANSSIDEYKPGAGWSTFAALPSQEFASALAFDASGDLFATELHYGVNQPGQQSVYEFSPSGVRSTFATGLDFPFGIAIQPGLQSTPEPDSILLVSGGVSGDDRPHKTEPADLGSVPGDFGPAMPVRWSVLVTPGCGVRRGGEEKDLSPLLGRTRNSESERVRLLWNTRTTRPRPAAERVFLSRWTPRRFQSGVVVPDAAKAICT